MRSLVLLLSTLAPLPGYGSDAILLSLAEDGDPLAQTVLASRYENAEGVARDYARAAELYCRAAKQGHADAQFRLGWMYANARGVAKNEPAAAHLFSLAASQGHEYAARMLRYLPEVSRPPVCLLEPVVAENILLLDHAQALTDARPADSVRKREIVALVNELAPQYAVDPELALAIITVESSFKPGAVSAKNAQGLMQLIPDTARRFSVRNTFNPAENVRGGLAYLQWLLAFFKGNVALVAAAYNAGERAVEKHRGIPPFPETQNYVKKITKLYKKSAHPYDAAITRPSLFAR
jgi:soluble lytic murein transglycosylase-like protein